MIFVVSLMNSIQLVLTLIPKVDDSGSLDDYKPICLIGSVYKILTKLLFNRLRLVVMRLISSTQLSFLLNRNMKDEVLVINEIMEFVKKKNIRCMVVNVNFKKAYGCVSWVFLDV